MFNPTAWLSVCQAVTPVEYIDFVQLASLNNRKMVQLKSRDKVIDTRTKVRRKVVVILSIKICDQRP